MSDGFSIQFDDEDLRRLLLEPADIAGEGPPLNRAEAKAFIAEAFTTARRNRVINGAECETAIAEVSAAVDRLADELQLS